MDLDFFQSVFSNFETVINCVRDHNTEFLPLQLPTFIESYNFFSDIAENIHDGNVSCTLSALLNLFQDQLVECENLLARSSNESPNTSVSNIHLSVLYNGRNGRPRIDIPVHVVNALRNCGASWVHIARHLNISPETLRNGRNRNNIDDPRAHQNLSDDELLAVVAEIKREHPSAGYRYVWSSLKCTGVFVPRRRLMESIRIIDPIGVLNRRRRRLRRRQYKVHASNYNWHMYGNEKLVSWNIYIHGAVDGLSRKIMYLELSLTKLAEEVLGFFSRGVTENGLPLRVRGDHGSENTGVCDFMNFTRSNVGTPFMYGRSVHNTRIERLWSEVNRVVSSKFHTIFHFLEEREVLSQLSFLDLLCLWYVYCPRIQKSLTNFKNSWNQLGLSTVNNRSPNDLWLSSLIGLSYESDVIASRLVPERLGFHSAFRRESLRELLLRSNLGIGSDAIEYYCTIFEEIVPDPMIDDDQEGISLYLTLKNHFVNE